MVIHSSGQTIFSLAHIEGITLVAGEEVDEVAGGAGGMGVDGIGEVGEGQAAGVSGRERSQGWDEGDKVSFDKELMAEGDRGGAGKKVVSGGIR